MGILILTKTNVKRQDLPGFDLGPVTVECFYRYVMAIEVDMSSCIEGINMKLCKLILENFMEKWVKIYSNSFHSGIFPSEWACSVVTLLPKTGDQNNPGNWRPISQTCIFAKILENIVKSRLLDYMLQNSILSEYQYGFLPNRSTQEAVFEMTKAMYSTSIIGNSWQ